MKKTSPLIAIIGAGPHGLAAAAHLRAAGARVRSFGEPLEFWRGQMPRGMVLRSRKRSSNISDPRGALRIEHYERDERKTVHQPSLLLEEFVDYGLWFQSRVVPDVDRRKIAELSRNNGGFDLRLDDGEKVYAERVIVAAGLSKFPRRPAPFAALSESLVSHACDHTDLSIFSDRRVAVIGAGQSALESAALLSEQGAQVEVFARTPEIRWLGDGHDVTPPWWRPPTDVGGTGNGWIAAIPDLFRRLPTSLQPTIAYRCIRPAGSGWLRPRLTRAVLCCGRSVVAAHQSGEGVRLELDDGSDRSVDHVLLGTGYQVDVAKYPFISPGLAEQISVSGGYPRLRPGLESSVAGLHFVGAPAALSFGPIMRFVVGTAYSAPAVARGVLGRLQPPLRFAF